MITRVLADARDNPVVEPYHAHWRHAADVLTRPWRARGRRKTLLRAGIGLALSDEQALELMLRLTCDRAG